MCIKFDFEFFSTSSSLEFIRLDLIATSQKHQKNQIDIDSLNGF